MNPEHVAKIRVGMTKHGHSSFYKHSLTYSSWHMMRQRCLNPKATSYNKYGGRGIVVCERWAKFEDFLADMGERPEGFHLDRINSDGDYEPGNCRWIPASQNGKLGAQKRYRR